MTPNHLTASINTKFPKKPSKMRTNEYLIINMTFELYHDIKNNNF